MTMSSSSLIIKIGANLKNFNKGMEEVHKKIRETFSKTEIAKMVAEMVATNAVLGGVAIKSMKIASNYQQASIAFEKLIGNAKSAKIFTDQLIDFAYSTPFDYDGLMKDAQALYQVGVAGNQIIPMLTAFSEAAAGIGKGQAEIDAMTNAIVHMQSVGEADVRTFESINRVGIPAWKMLAKAMNTTEQAAKDAVEKHMVSASQATEILVKGMNDMYAGMMKMQETKTFNGALANLKGNVEHTLLEIGRIILKEYDIIPFINKVSNAFGTFAKTLRDENLDEALMEVFGPKITGLIVGVAVAINIRAIPAMAALGSYMVDVDQKASILKGGLMALTNVAAAALGALAALVTYKYTLGIEGYDVSDNPDIYSEDDEAAVNESKAALIEGKARRKAAEAKEKAKALAEMKAEEPVVNTNPITNGPSGGRAGGGAGKSAEDMERERRQQAMQTAKDELSSLRAVQDAMKESAALRKAYMTAAASETYEMKSQHEDAIQRIQDRWQEFEIAYIGMSDEERSRTIDNLEKMGAAYKVTEEGRLSLAEQINADILAENKRYMDETTEYYIQCKDLMAERDEAFRTNSLEALQALLTEENAARLNAFNTQQSAMQRYYENWLEIHKTTNERVSEIIMNSQSSFENFFTNVLSGTKSFGDSLMDLVNGILNEIVSSIARMMAAKVVNQLLGWIMPGFAGGGIANFGNNTGLASMPPVIRPPGGATGGRIIGPGSGTSDSVPAWLSNGEYVISADAVRKVGVPFLNALNRGQAPRFASGGYVGGSKMSAAGCNVQINISNESGQPLQAQQTGSRFDGESYIIDVVVNAFSTNRSGLRTMVKGVAAT